MCQNENLGGVGRLRHFDDVDWSKYLPARDQEELALLKATLDAMTDEEFAEILRAVAPGNPLGEAAIAAWDAEQAKKRDGDN